MAEAHRRLRSKLDQQFTVEPIPLRPFVDAGSLLYQGPWVAERYVEFGEFLTREPQAVLPVVAEIINGGARFSATDVFGAQYRLAELKSLTERALSRRVDVAVLPTIGTTFTVDEVVAAPITTNTRLGHYTHCGNLLDLCAVAVPAGLHGRRTARQRHGPRTRRSPTTLILAVAVELKLSHPS